MFRTIAFVALTIVAPSIARSQSFEVASVRRNTSARGGGNIEFPPGGERFSAVNVTLAGLIVTAYNIAARQCSCQNSALPVLWEQFDIQAKAEHPVNAAGMRRLLESLLEDRFRLRVRRETRSMDAYALIVDKSGSKLHPSAAPPADHDAPLNPYHARGAEPSSGHLLFAGETLPEFAWRLSTLVVLDSRVVVDKTGLAGRYDIELNYGTEADSVAPSIFTALREQLGLRLDLRKLPIEVITVEHAERPTDS